MKNKQALPGTNNLEGEQTREYRATWFEDGTKMLIKASVRYGDRCKNGHNTLAITGDLYQATGGRMKLISCGQLPDIIAKRIPELRNVLKWHLVSTDGPMHYLANTMYHASEVPEKQDRWYFYLESKLIKIVGLDERTQMVRKYGNLAVFKGVPNPSAKSADLEAARSSALWPDATLDQLLNENMLKARLPGLMVGFRRVIDNMGFEY